MIEVLLQILIQSKVRQRDRQAWAPFSWYLIYLLASVLIYIYKLEREKEAAGPVNVLEEINGTDGKEEIKRYRYFTKGILQI